MTDKEMKECKYLGKHWGDCWKVSGNIFQKCLYKNKEKCVLLKNELLTNKIDNLERKLKQKEQELKPFKDKYFSGLTNENIAELAKKSIRLTAYNSELQENETLTAELEKSDRKGYEEFVRAEIFKKRLDTAIEALEKIAYRDITIKSNFYSSTVAVEALQKIKGNE